MILLSVSLITFNQKEYIAQAIESVLMQKTNFNFELVLSDDCSTDGTRDICIDYQKKYPDLIRLRLPKKNQGLIINMRENLSACVGKYIAILEGDDFWIDPYKLQKQVDFLEQNPTCGLVCTNFEALDIATGEKKQATSFSKIPLRENYSYSFKELFDYNFVGSPTAVFINKFDYRNVLSDSYKTGDLPLWFEIIERYRVYYIADVTACYRNIQDSLSHQIDGYKSFKFWTSVEDIKYKYALRNGDRFPYESTYIRLKRDQLEQSFRHYDKPYFEEAYNLLRILDKEYLCLPKKVCKCIVGNKILTKFYYKLRYIRYRATQILELT